MQTKLHEFEGHLLRGATEAARILGLAYSTYAAYKAGSRPLPRYVEGHVEALMALPLDTLHHLVAKRLTRKGKKKA